MVICGRSEALSLLGYADQIEAERSRILAALLLRVDELAERVVTDLVDLLVAIALVGATRATCPPPAG